MGCGRSLFKCGAISALLVALLVGAILAGIPAKVGLLRVAVQLMPDTVGLVPILMRASDWQVTYTEIGNFNLSGQSAVVTGANTGLGFYTSLHLARQGAQVFMCCRTVSKCNAAAAKIKSNSSVRGSVIPVRMDTSSLKSVKAASYEILEKIKSLDMLVLNAGIATAPYKLSEDGFEFVFATNHIGHQLLFTLLRPLLASGGATGAARVVLVSSAFHFISYSYGVPVDLATLTTRPEPEDGRVYGRSKLANVLFAQEVSRRASLAGEPIFANSLHPGAVDTAIWSGLEDKMREGLEACLPVGLKKRVGEMLSDFFNLLRPALMWTSEEGAITQIYLAASPMIKERQVRGRYFHPMASEVLPCRTHATNLTLQRQLYDFTDTLIAPFLN